MGNTNYDMLVRQLEALLAGERHWLPNLANTAALLFAELSGINWVGFYLLRNDELVLGPFQGKPACVRIALSEGVCGHTALRKKSTIVPDVHQFPGHIACDPASRSELVIPLITNTGCLVGVLDVDSSLPARFTREDARGLEKMMDVLLSLTSWPEVQSVML